MRLRRRNAQGRERGPLRAARVCPSWLPFLLSSQLSDESPVCALGNNPLRARLDHANLLQLQRVEAYRVLRVVLSPMAINGRHLPHGLEGVFVAGGVTLVYEEPGDAFRISGADVGRFENRPQRPFRG